MKTIQLFLIAIFFISCKPADFSIRAPASMSGAIVNFDHTDFMQVNCMQCHENKRPQTIPTHGNGSDCITCHTASLNASGVRSWKNVTSFDHNPMPTSCVTCHEGIRPKTIAPHMTGQWGEKQDCVSCHVPTIWKAGTFDHKKDNLSCVECHRTATRDDRPMPLNSHPTPAYNQIDCKFCHTNSANTNKWTDRIFDHNTHSPLPTSCTSCHESIRPLSHTVLPLIAGMEKGDCKGCHTNTSKFDINGSLYATPWKIGVVAFNHESTKPTSCTGCHQNNAPLPITSHPVATGTYYKIDCVKCHTYDATTSARSWKKIIFNQTTHSPTPAKCMQCHKIDNNSLPKTGTTHLTGGRANLDCSSCHFADPIGKNWKNLTPFKHTTLDSTDRCDSCHNLTTSNAFASNTIVTKITAKPTAHVLTTLDCKSCHTTNAWKPATFIHSTTDTNCMVCHNGTTATAKTTTHVPTTQQCSLCHTQAGWKPAVFRHATTDTNCKTCHNGTTATGRPLTGTKKHILPIANQECSACHVNNNTTLKWAAVYTTTTYKHSSAGQLPPKGTTFHKSQTSCTLCHQTLNDNVKYADRTSSATYATVSANATYYSCLKCHVTDFLKQHKTTEYATKGNCLTCHSYNGF